MYYVYVPKSLRKKLILEFPALKTFFYQHGEEKNETVSQQFFDSVGFCCTYSKLLVLLFALKSVNAQAAWINSGYLSLPMSINNLQ